MVGALILVVSPILCRHLDLVICSILLVLLMHAFCHMNSSFDTHHARANSWGTLHAARINSGVMLSRTGVRKIRAVEFGEEQSQGV